ncbi:MULTISPECIES: hypothetical protein [Streptomyces]|uniref:Inositol oxygenase n=1 Tax=Streptomyces bobili TaxID=67280 RepID=A0ABZ1QTQ2_9ACTN|nr:MULTISPECIES: hypothetical protein [Streptomyces]QEU69356.1 hypothetical protein CP966_31895 [Streptomyces galilaeus]GGW75461.1 hypothetical protein GCM10010350_70430 [Streptomyces galilaeus]
MELRSVEELMDLLHRGRGVWDTPAPGAHGARGAGGRGGDTRRAGAPGVDVHDHALQTAALLRRSRPADKELQVTGLVHPIGRLLSPADVAGRAGHAAEAVRALLGERVARLVRRHPWHGPAADDDLARLRQADEDGRVAGFDAGVLEDWRTVLELVAARNSRLGAVD